MAIHYLDGSRLKDAVVAGAQRVIQLQEHLNNINVFPVPDGDTGTNMALTLKSVADGVLNSKSTDIGVISALVAEHALLGARGNSGAILAQFFQGLAQSLAGGS
jgi:dihydroxyacetone kinase-like predicted kinase